MIAFDAYRPLNKKMTTNNTGRLMINLANLDADIGRLTNKSNIFVVEFDNDTILHEIIEPFDYMYSK